MKSFLLRHKDQILGVLSGFDRLRFRGSLRPLQREAGVIHWLQRIGIALKDFPAYAEGLTKQLLSGRRNKLTTDAGREVRYLQPGVTRSNRFTTFAPRQRVAENGLIAVLSTLEMGMSYEVFRRKDQLRVAEPAFRASANTITSTGTMGSSA